MARLIVKTVFEDIRSLMHGNVLLVTLSVTWISFGLPTDDGDILTSPAWIALQVDYTPPQMRGKAQSVLQILSAITAFFSSLVSGYLYDLDHALPFWIYTFFAFLATIAAFFMIHDIKLSPFECVIYLTCQFTSRVKSCPKGGRHSGSHSELSGPADLPSEAAGMDDCVSPTIL